MVQRDKRPVRRYAAALWIALAGVSSGFWVLVDWRGFTEWGMVWNFGEGQSG